MIQKFLPGLLFHEQCKIGSKPIQILHIRSAVIFLLFFAAGVIHLQFQNYHQAVTWISLKTDLQLNENESNRNFTSTCSWQSDQRGYNQKVVAYSIYGNLSDTDLVRRYLGCFKVTLKKIPEAFPGWVVRIYHNLSRSDKSGWKNLQDSLPADRDFIDLCNASKIIEQRKLGNLFPMTWRFLPMLDDLVDISMSRDTDSPLLTREEVAVHEWLESSQTFHTMRDHPDHCIPMLGGLWGAKLNQNRQEITNAFQKIMTQNHSQSTVKGYDQILLVEYIWPIAENDLISHDSYCCGYYRSKPFSTPRQGGKFVGMVAVTGCQANISFDENIQVCPKRCRPKNNLFNWRYC